MMPITDAPAAASDFAMAAPMPFGAPVTTATLPVSLLMVIVLFGWSGDGCEQTWRNRFEKHAY